MCPLPICQDRISKTTLQFAMYLFNNWFLKNNLGILFKQKKLCNHLSASGMTAGIYVSIALSTIMYKPYSGSVCQKQNLLISFNDTKVVAKKHMLLLSFTNGKLCGLQISHPFCRVANVLVSMLWCNPSIQSYCNV